jgi:hypothetical protein
MTVALEQQIVPNVAVFACAGERPDQAYEYTGID